MSVRGFWDRAVDAWMDDELDELDVAWDGVLDLIGSAYDGYSSYVSSIGWAA